MIRRLGFGFLIVCLCFLGANIVGAVWPRVVAQSGDAEVAKYPVYLVAGPIHYDFVLPVRPNVQNRFEDVLDQSGASEFALFGWGSRAFYTTAGQYSDVRLNAVWTALTGDASVLRVDRFDGFDPEDYDAVVLHLSDAQMDALLGFISAEFVYGADGVPLREPVSGFGATDRFYQARSRFSGVRTCNVWVADALQAAGVSTGVWTPTTLGLRLSL